MSLRKYSDLAFTEVSSVKKHMDNEFYDASFIRKLDGSNWIDIWPDSNLNGSLVRLLEARYVPDGYSINNPQRTWGYSEASNGIQGRTTVTSWNTGEAITYFVTPNNLKLKNCRSFTVYSTIGFFSSPDVSSVQCSFRLFLFGDKQYSYGFIYTHYYPDPGKPPTATLNGILYAEDGIPSYDGNYNIQIDISSGISHNYGTSGSGSCILNLHDLIANG